MNSNQQAVLRCDDLCHIYGSGETQVEVLKSLNFSVNKGQRLAIMGSSGAGKSTLLNLLGGLDKPSQGEVWLAGSCMSQLSANDRARLRNQSLGFVYQFHHLMPEFSALENATMPCLIAGETKKQAYEKAQVLLEKVGLNHRIKHKPAQLSGGERQRVAIARALVMQPDCVLLDEPTGNLDVNTAQHVQQLLLDLSQNLGTAFVVVTHDPVLAKTMDEVYELSNGKLAVSA